MIGRGDQITNTDDSHCGCHARCTIAARTPPTDTNAITIVVIRKDSDSGPPVNTEPALRIVTYTSPTTTAFTVTNEIKAVSISSGSASPPQKPNTEIRDHSPQCRY